MMITSAEEFLRLRSSDDLEEQDRASWEEADISVWYEVLKQYPDTGEQEAPNGPIPEGAWIRKWVAHNKKLPEAIIRILAKDSSWRVRNTIAMKRKTPPDVLKDLSTDPDEGIRHSVAFNKKTPKYILESMLDDPWEEVVLTVKERLGLPTPPPMPTELWLSIKKKQAEDETYLNRIRFKK